MNKLRLLIVSEQNDFDKKLSNTIKKFSSERNLFFANLYNNSINWNSNNNLNEYNGEKVDKSNKSFFRGTLLKRCKSSKDVYKTETKIHDNDRENQLSHRQSFNLDEFDKKYLFSQNRKNIVKELRKNFENFSDNKVQQPPSPVLAKPPSGSSRRQPTPFKKCEFSANDLEKRLSLREKSVNVNSPQKRIITRHSFYLHRNESDAYEVGDGCDDCARVKHKARQLIEMFGRAENHHHHSPPPVRPNTIGPGGGISADRASEVNNNQNNREVRVDGYGGGGVCNKPSAKSNLDAIFITRNNLLNEHQKRRSLNAAITRDNNLYRNLLSDSFEDSKFGIKKSGSVNKIDLEILKSELDDYVDPMWQANVGLGYGFRSQRTLRTSRKHGNNERHLKSSDTQILKPATAIRAIGYTPDAGRTFDVIIKAKLQKSKLTWERKFLEPQEKYKNLEFKIESILEESIFQSTELHANYALALSKAKEAFILDRTLLRLRDQNNEAPSHNFDLTFSVIFNLAHQYTKNEMYVEALNTYTIITKDKIFSNANRLKLNMGNIYFKMGMFPKAIKMYRMALDQIPNNHKELRLKIIQNIGLLFIKMGQYSDAAASFEFIMSEKADFKSGMHLILCYYAMGDVQKIKNSFRALIDIQLDHEDDLVNIQANRFVFEAIKSDSITKYLNKKKRFSEKCILMLVELISSVIEETYIEGYNWCIEVIKSSNFAWLTYELELNKALVYLKQNEVAQAIDTLQYYLKKDTPIAVNALINLTFIFIYLGDLQSAARYIKKCRQIDNYNPAVFINSSVVSYQMGEFETAKQYLETALTLDMTSYEAMYNLGMVMKKLDDYKGAEVIFKKIRQSLSSEKHAHLFYQIATLEECCGRTSTALDWYLQIVSICQEMDSKLFQRIGDIYDSFNDKQESNHYYNEAYRINPSDVSIASSIGSYYVKLQALEKAIFYHERAVLSNPTDVNLMLYAASCYRQIYSPRNYLALLERIYAQFPENISCLRVLMYISKSVGMMDEYERYSSEYTRIEWILQRRKII